MRLKNAKRIIFILLAFVIMLGFAFTITYLHNKKEIQNISQNDIQVQAAIFNSDGSAISDNDYNGFSYFNIYDQNQFLSFKKSLFYYNFSGKTIYLHCDIDLSDVAWDHSQERYCFAGLFDGCGHIITGAGKTLSTGGGLDYCGSLFGTIYGNKWTEYGHNGSREVYPGVENLRLKDFYAKQQSSGYFRSGALAEQVVGDVKISNVSVVNYNVEIPIHGESYYSRVGGLIGEIHNTNSRVSISDCEIIGFEATARCQTTHIAGIVGYIEGGNNTITRCVVCDFTHKEHIQYEPEDYKVADYYFSANTSVVSLTNCCNSAQNSISSFSNWGNVSSDPWSTWFYDSTYNNKYPKLASWLGENKTFYFYYNEANKSTNNGYVKVNSGNFYNSGEYLYITQPNEINILYTDKIAKIIIGDKEVEAVPESEYYVFSHWGTPDNYSYFAYFKPVERTITFNDASGTVAALTNPISPSSSTTYTIYYGTEISVSHQTGDGAFTLTYTFQNTSGSTVTVTYNITAEYKLTSAGWNNGDAITVNSQIQPVVTPKLYTVTFKGNADTSITTAQTWQVYYGTNITYGISNNEVTFTSNKTLNSGTSPVKYSPKNSYYTFEHLKVNSTTYTTGGTISNITANKTIEVSYLRWYDVTFTTSITGVASSSTLNGKTNPVKLRKGSEIKGNYTGYAGKTLTYTATYGGESTEIFRYNIANYYIVTNTDDINNLDGTDLTITPTLEFYACTVTMGDISSTVGTRSGYTSPFIVEYGTIVKFTATQTNSIFTYTYTFTYGGSTIKTITYTMKSNQYAMTSTVNGDHRVWHTDIGSNNAVEYEVGRTSDGTAMTISPTFGLKEYAGDLN